MRQVENARGRKPAQREREERADGRQGKQRDGAGEGHVGGVDGAAKAGECRSTYSARKSPS